MKKGNFNNDLENIQKCSEEIVNDILSKIMKGDLNQIPKLKSFTEDELTELTRLFKSSTPDRQVKPIPIQFRLIHHHPKN
ncbi:hypothetical protein A9Q91_04305 [Candidatus Gracilibacteria bacterium 28_42_T64]|nr:hypothetical protein A9Q91_04305 [Candidatus Gracilibacteria bacterium 28_42_T64]